MKVLSRFLVIPPLPVVLAAAIVTVFGGCDAVDFRSGTEDEGSHSSLDVPVEAESAEQIDLQYAPVSLSPGETFVIDLSDARRDRPAARILHEGRPDGRALLEANFPTLRPTRITVVCRNERTGEEQKIRTMPSRSFEPDTGLAPIAKTDDDPDSYHYENDGETTIISVDYDDDSKSMETASKPSFDFQSTEQGAECTHVDFRLGGVSTAVSPDGVKFAGSTDAPRVRSTSIR